MGMKKIISIKPDGPANEGSKGVTFKKLDKTKKVSQNNTTVHDILPIENNKKSNEVFNNTHINKSYLNIYYNTIYCIV